MNVSKRTLVTAGLTVGAATLLYLSSDSLYQVLDLWLHGAEKARILLKLRRIRAAGYNWLFELNASERDCRDAVRNKVPLTLSLRNKILCLAVDLDYMFKHLDAVEGDESIKAQRKLLVNKLKVHATRVDLLVALVKES
jgi:hypothetical protein